MDFFCLTMYFLFLSEPYSSSRYSYSNVKSGFVKTVHCDAASKYVYVPRGKGRRESERGWLEIERGGERKCYRRRYHAKPNVPFSYSSVDITGSSYLWNHVEYFL